MICRKNLQLFVFFMILFCTCPVSAYSPNQILGDASEGMMQDYFEAGGWKSLPGQIGTKGMDGLFVKYDENGTIRDVLVAESKYNTSRLGQNLVCGQRQMSNTWILCKLDDLIRNSDQKNDPETVRKYEQIRNHVRNDNYRGILWRTECTDGKLHVSLEQVKSRGTEIELQNLRGGSKYKIQYQGNQSIDLKNPADPFQKRIADSYYLHLEKSMIRQGMPEPEISRLLSEFRKNPAQTDTLLHRYVPISVPVSRTGITSAPKTNPYLRVRTVSASSAMSKVSKQISGRAGKSLFKNIVKRGFSGALAGSAGGPWGMAVGLLSSVTIGVAADYLLDTAVQTAFAWDQAPPASYMQEVQQGMSVAENEIQAVRERMENEFRILGSDIQAKHEAEMDAIHANFQEIVKVGKDVQRVEQKVDGLHADLLDFRQDMLQGMQMLSLTLTDMNASLTQMAVRVDQIYERLDAMIKAEFDNGVEQMELFDSTGETLHLQNALNSFLNFRNTFRRISGKTQEEEQMLSLTDYYLAAVNADLYSKTKNAGYAQSSVNAFMQMAAGTSDLNLLIMTCLSIREADMSGTAVKELFRLSKEMIREKLEKREFDYARQFAHSLDMMFADGDISAWKNAVVSFAEKGGDQSGILNLRNEGYRAILSFAAEGKKIQYNPEIPDYLLHIINGRTAPNDFQRLADQYRSMEITRFAVRSLAKKNYYADALKILQKYPVGDDTFRVKAYLLLYKETGSPKFSQLRNLVLENETYTPEAKEFARRMT